MPGTGLGPGDRAARGPGSTASRAWLVKVSEGEDCCPCREVNEGGWSRLGAGAGHTGGHQAPAKTGRVSSQQGPEGDPASSRLRVSTGAGPAPTTDAGLFPGMSSPPPLTGSGGHALQ